MVVDDRGTQFPQWGRSQAILAHTADASIFLVLVIRPGAEAAVRDMFEDVSGMIRAVGARDPHAELGCVVGIGAEAWGRLYDLSAPAGLHVLPTFEGDPHRSVTTPGDVLFHLRGRRFDMCFELAQVLVRRLDGCADVVDEVAAFRYFDHRDLLGFVEGTENPAGEEAVRSVFIGSEDPNYADGSYVVVQKYLHDMTAWDGVPVEEQERIIGRHKLSDIELPDDVKPSRSHVTLTTITEPDGTERKIVRDNMPFGTVGTGEFGTYFIGYTCDPAVIEEMLRRMFVGEPAGNYDRTLDFSTPVTGTLFFVPTTEFLDDQPRPASADASSPKDG